MAGVFTTVQCEVDQEVHCAVLRSLGPGSRCGARLLVFEQINKDMVCILER